MVDRIVPATTDQHRAEAARLTGLDDHGLVVGSRSRSGSSRTGSPGTGPPGNKAPRSRPTSRRTSARRRGCSASHSTLAYLGALRGYETIAEAIARSALEAVVHLVDEDVLPTLKRPTGSTSRSTARTCWRGRQPERRPHHGAGRDGRLRETPQRLLGAVRDRLAAGAVPTAAAATIAAWMSYVHATTQGSSRSRAAGAARRPARRCARLGSRRVRRWSAGAPARRAPGLRRRPRRVRCCGARCRRTCARSLPSDGRPNGARLRTRAAA